MNQQPWYYMFAQPFMTITSVCTNTSTQTSYITGVLTLLNNIQQNATYNAVLQSRSPNFIAYVRNSVNQALLYQNCPAFVTGVKAAKSADAAMERSRCQVVRDIYQRLRQVPRTATNTVGPTDVDSSEKHDHHC